MAIGTLTAIGSLVAAGAAAGQFINTLVQGAPGIPEIPPSKLAPPPAPKPLPPAAPTDTTDKGAQKAVQRIREQSRRRAASSTILTSPLGISNTAASTKTSVLGR